MPTTPLGLTYPDSGGHTRLWEHLRTLATDVDTRLSELSEVPPFASFTGTITANGWQDVGNLAIESTPASVGTWQVAAGTITPPSPGIYLVAISGARESGTASPVLALQVTGAAYPGTDNRWWLEEPGGARVSSGSRVVRITSTFKPMAYDATGWRITVTAVKVG